VSEVLEWFNLARATGNKIAAFMKGVKFAGFEVF
jgi:hypothetical protein